jgi:hypothetical protein
MRVNGSRYQLFAGSGLACDQHSGIHRCNAANRIEHLTHCGSPANYAGEGGGGDRACPGPALQQLCNAGAQYIGLHWFGQEIISAQMKRFHGDVHRAEAADDQDRNALTPEAKRFHDAQTVGSRQAQIEQHEVEALLTQCTHGLFAIGGYDDIISILSKQRGRRYAKRPVVIDQQQTGWYFIAQVLTSFETARCAA